VIPVVLQDPVWEQSFPPVDALVMRVASVGGEVRDVWLGRREVQQRRREHEQRWEDLMTAFRGADVEPVVVHSAAEDEVLRAFLDWSEQRRASTGDGW
jgi:hypothetical protein